MNETKQLNTTSKSVSTQKISTRNLVLTGMFTAVICVMAQISVPIQPIPFTLSIFAIFLTGAILEPKYAFLSVLAYLLLGAFGLPVFAGMKGGVGELFGMTGGYKMAFPIMAFVIAFIYKQSKNHKTIALTVGMALSLLLCYLIGTAWFSIISGTGFYKALTLCVFPFVLFDVVKIALAVSLGTIIRKAIAKLSL